MSGAACSGALGVSVSSPVDRDLREARSNISTQPASVSGPEAPAKARGPTAFKQAE